jgi:signal transduction histidine kinase
MMARIARSLGPPWVKHWTTRLAASPAAAGFIALLLLVAGIAFALQIDRISLSEKQRQASVQAQTLASGIAAPLAFGDQMTLREYLEALHADPQIVAVAAYDASGKFVAGYSVPPASLPSHAVRSAQPVSERDLIVTAEVAQGGTHLGMVYLHASLDSWPRRATRYAGIAAIVALASLLIATLGASYASLNEAHIRLKEETASREQAEEALRQSQKMEALGQLTGGVAHDFNNLLMVASGSLDLMERTGDPARLERLRSAIRQAVDRGSKLTQQLLAFSRRSPLKAEVIALQSRLQGMDTLLDQLMTHGVTIATNFSSDLWPVKVDPSELEVAMLNVVLNARDAMPQGGVIRIEASNDFGGGKAADRVRIAIADSGTGIAPEAIGRIFEPFFTTKGAGQGTGLGLSQVYGFARASGGDVEVDSEVGKGTTIAILLPRSEEMPLEILDEAVIIEAAGPRRILFVEDNDTVADMVGAMLEEIGYSPERVASGDEALSHLNRDAAYALVLSDMIMPGTLNGLELVHEIGRKWPKLRYVLMTGYSQASETAKNEDIPLLLKPFTIETLSAQLKRVLAQV